MFSRQKKRFNWTAVKLVIFMILIFILQSFFSSLTENFSLVAADVASRPWILITSVFLHGGIAHLLFNILSLFLFGSFLEKKVGTSKFLFVFFFTGLVASIAASFFYERALGASGAIYGIIGALVVLQPLLPVFAFGVPMPLIVASVFWILLDFAGFSSYLAGLPSGIANAAHLAGIFSGIVLGLLIKGFIKRRI